MRILHTSDWHIGRQFHNVTLLDDQRHILNEILSIIEKEKVDVVLVAGDIYDRSVPPADAVALLDEVVDKISHQIKVPMIMISGNHDSAKRLSFGARQMARSGVHIVGNLYTEPQPVILEDDFGEVAFYGIPYVDPATVKDALDCDVHTHEEALLALTEQVKQHNPEDRRCVVLSHCFIDGGEASDSERPLSVGGADKVSYKLFKTFNYTALGHLHGPQYKGDESIRYSGSILKYSFSEVNHNKSVTLVDMDAKGECEIKKIALTPRRDMRIVEGFMNDILRQAKDDQNSEDYLLVRLLDTHALYEPMAKLRAVYPNVLQLERPSLNRSGEQQAVKRENLKKGELPMFLDFYQQMTDEALGDNAVSYVASLLDQIHQGQEK